jgi:hypothetical protein
VGSICSGGTAAWFLAANIIPISAEPLPASVCSECIFLLKELQKAPRESTFLQSMSPRFIETNKNIAANAGSGVQTEDFAQRVGIERNVT